MVALIRTLEVRTKTASRKHRRVTKIAACIWDRSPTFLLMYERSLSTVGVKIKALMVRWKKKKKIIRE